MKNSGMLQIHFIPYFISASVMHYVDDTAFYFETKSSCGTSDNALVLDSML